MEHWKIHQHMVMHFVQKATLGRTYVIFIDSLKGSDEDHRTINPFSVAYLKAIFHKLILKV